MIDADIRGKLRRDGGSVHDRSEDLLTSTVFGLLRHLPVAVALKPMIENARPAGELLKSGSARISGEPWIDLAAATQCDIVFWPSFGSWGQPDILLVFRDDHHRVVHLVVVEAKLFSSKSGEATDADEDSATDDSTWHPDQLVRYWRGLLHHPEYNAAAPRSVVYLTAHPGPPLDDLQKSLIACPSMGLGWMSWRHIWDVVASIANAPGSPPAAVDLERLLAYRGFRSLNAFKMPPIGIRVAGHFWTAKPWFSGQPVLSFGDGRAFWRTT